jgi:hypothetical protein
MFGRVANGEDGPDPQPWDKNITTNPAITQAYRSICTPLFFPAKMHELGLGRVQ